MVSFFKEKSPASVFWLIVACFGLHIHSLINTPQVLIAPADGFFYYILHPLKNAGSYFISLLYIFLIFVLALQINYVMNALHMLPKFSYTPALAFILFSALLPAFKAVNTALFANILLVWVLYRACKLYAAPNAKTAIYNFGLLIGSCVILYFSSLPLVLIAFIALAIIRPFRLNEWFVLFFGIITPAYFLGAWLFLTGRLNLLPQPQQLFGLFKIAVPPIPIIISLATAGIATLWGIFSVQGASANVLIQIRKSWLVFFVTLLLLVPVIFFVNNAYPAALLLIAVPAACYAGFAFASNRNILPVLFFWLLIALAIYNNWFAKY